jgi:hypothetical protein
MRWGSKTLAVTSLAWLAGSGDNSGQDGIPETDKCNQPHTPAIREGACG